MQRLKSRQQFQVVMTGAPVAKTPHFALHSTGLGHASDARLLFPVADTWLGVLLPKRWARRAVTRNAIRRQIYETARTMAPDLPQVALVVREVEPHPVGVLAVDDGAEVLDRSIAVGDRISVDDFGKE